MNVSNRLDKRMPLTIYEAMESDVETLRGDDRLIKALKTMRERDFDQMPVVDERGSLTGVVCHRWLVQDGHALNAPAARSTLISNVMRRRDEFPPGMVLQEDVKVCDLLDYYYHHDFLIVVGAGDKVVGIVQLWDVARELCKGLDTPAPLGPGPQPFAAPRQPSFTRLPRPRW